MSTRDYLIDTAIRHQVFTERYIAGQARTADRIMADMAREIGLAITGREIDVATMDEVREILRDHYSQVADHVVDGAGEFIVSEGDFVHEVYSRTTDEELNQPEEADLQRLVAEGTITTSAGGVFVIRSMMKQFAQRKTEQILGLITDGAATGLTSQEIASSIYTMQRTLHRRQVAALVSTITNHLAAKARERFFTINTKVTDRYEWVSTLDSRTTFVCMSRDGEVYRHGEGPLPPAHWACRSTIIGRIKPKFDLGLDIKSTRPAVNEDGASRVSGKTTYAGWLKTQSKEFIDEALGVERSKLFRSGKIKLDKFVDPTGRVYTLDELAGQRPIELAGL
ncbi:MAG TPA: hypothetical protein DCZ13_01720 [Porticoccaceae bacterium]|nr:hypothetical protein [Porticoccaceae bacterium]